MDGHAVELIGWGTTDDGEDYWGHWHALIENFIVSSAETSLDYII